MKTPKEALHLFDRLLAAKNPLPSVHPFNQLLASLIRAKISADPFPAALSLFGRLTRAEGIRPDARTYGIMVICCVQAGHVKLGLGFLLRLLKEGHMADGGIFSPLIGGLRRENRVNEAARMVLDKMPKMGCVPDVTLYNILIDGFCSSGETGLALQLILRMLKHGCGYEPNVITYYTVIIRLFIEGEFEKVFGLYKQMRFAGLQPYVVTHTSLISGLCNKGAPDKAEQLLRDMISEGLRPEAVTYATILYG